jgi:hypothetical protein
VGPGGGGLRFLPRHKTALSTIQVSAVQISAIQVSAIQISAIQISAIQISAIQISAIQISAIQISAIRQAHEPPRHGAGPHRMLSVRAVRVTGEVLDQRWVITRS